MTEKKKQIVSFSGGRTSAYLCYLLKKQYGDDLIAIFNDTGAEHPETYKFIKKVDKWLDLKLIVLEADINQQKGIGTSYIQKSVADIGWNLTTFEKMIKKYNAFGALIRVCTNILKITPTNKYIKEHIGDNHNLWLGIRADEPKRLKNRRHNIKFLADISNFNKDKIIRFWGRQSFNLNLPEYMGNCIFCPVKSVSRVSLAVKDTDNKYWVEWCKMLEQFERPAIKAPYRDNTSYQVINFIDETNTKDELLHRVRNGATLSACDGGACEPYSPDIFDDYN